MKTAVIATLIAASALLSGVATANADTFAVHGYATHYGR
jgi:hypothetical protein